MPAPLAKIAVMRAGRQLVLSAHETSTAASDCLAYSTCMISSRLSRLQDRASREGCQ